MSFIADLHIHSKYSRATSPDMSPESIWRWAQLKGITVIGTGDFTHPQWFGELTEKLEQTGTGLLTLKAAFHDAGVPLSCRADVLFLLSAEISCIYRNHGKTRKIHAVLLAPDFASAAKINTRLSKIGNLAADGRPSLRVDVRELLQVVLESSPEAMLVPAHAWTPHFSVFGAASGFDSLTECFQELTPHIHAIETGLSSDPPMNRRLSALDTITLVSNSDAHSPSKIGREANIFDTEVSYHGITEAVKTRKGFVGTIEYFPEEGKYHYDGHRVCGVRFSPSEATDHGCLCPSCGKRLTVGVLHRVEELADRACGIRPENALAYRRVIPLREILAETLKADVQSKNVMNEYANLLTTLGNELTILMDLPVADIRDAGSRLIGEAIARVREGMVHITPGFDGEYGKIKIFEEAERREANKREGSSVNRRRRSGSPSRASLPRHRAS